MQVAGGAAVAAAAAAASLCCLRRRRRCGDPAAVAHFDDDRSMSSYIEDVGHFLAVLSAMAKDARVLGESSPVPNRISAQDIAAWQEAYTRVEDRLSDSDVEVVEERMDAELRKLARDVLSGFQRVLLNWHCVNFFPFHEKFSAAYLRYVDAFCDGFADDHLQNFLLQGVRDYFLSAYSYSHRVKGASLNSARVSYGAAADITPRLEAALRDVLADEKVALPAPFGGDGAFKLYGLGWDYGAKPAHIKVYLHGELADLPAGMLDVGKLGLPCGDDLRSHGLVAFTVERAKEKGAQAEIVETKVYLYPTDDAAKPEALSGVLNVAYVISVGSAARGVFQQWDVTHTEDGNETPEWRERFNCTGQSVYDKYNQTGMRLDTLAYGGTNDFTLYFPFEP
eukprot:TRINITY_DN35836_c0_g1_i1.p1 TRINITY_DN35836_c0_g1~~TRINITY_DN35836_c0_g1_i1.p1  ORF type:complete len:422 (+),score=136.06 TRINITY_DN35836_c0_g1_i1:83-1267(+)